MKLSHIGEIFVKLMSQLSCKHIDNYFFVAKYFLARSICLEHKRLISYQNIDILIFIATGSCSGSKNGLTLA